MYNKKKMCTMLVYPPAFSSVAGSCQEMISSPAVSQ